MTRDVRHTWGLVAAALVLGGLWTTRAEASTGPGDILAQRAREHVTVDGRLDEPDWGMAPVFEAFIQRFPKSSTAPSERTELRVLYDNRYLYVGVVCHDSQPASINRNLGRRDTQLDTDSVQVFLDTLHDHRSAYVFSLSAGGVQTDGLLYEDNQYTTDWDGVWEGATSLVADGWVAEYAIPLSLLRFPATSLQTWGFSVRRQVARLNEEVESVDNPRTSNAVVSRLGHLDGLRDLEPGRGLRVLPYLAVRSIAHSNDDALPGAGAMNPSMDLGLDLQASLTSHMTLAATLNPDFGQVDADRLLLNLSTFEQLFPEKRPFFTQGLDLFQPVGSSLGAVPQTLFYSRRIGLDTPIFGAARLTGSTASGLEVGVLDAVVAGPWRQGGEDLPPSRGVRLHASRPLHLGLVDDLPTEEPVPLNYLATVVRGRAGANLRIGGTLTAATPLTGTCTAADASGESALPVSCRARGGNAAAVDLDVRSDDGTYGAVGQFTGSQVVGGPPERTLRDGTLLSRGETGLGGYVRAGRFNGAGPRWDVGYDFASPTLELNASGFQRTQNEHAGRLNVHLLREKNQGSLKSLFADMEVISRWTTDGRGLHRGTSIRLGGGVQLPSFDTVGMEAGTDLAAWTVRELAVTGIPLETAQTGYVALYANSKPTRPLLVDVYLGLNRRFRSAAASPTRQGWVTNVSAKLRPHPGLETRLEVFWDFTPQGPRFIETSGDNQFLLGDLTSRSLSMTLRQSWVITPRLTLQGYAQLFGATANYGDFFLGNSDAARTRIRYADLSSTSREDVYSFSQSAVNLNIVLRWEYRLGSTLYLVYSRSQQSLPSEGGARPRLNLFPSSLFEGPTDDALMVKWSWFLDA